MVAWLGEIVEDSLSLSAKLSQCEAEKKISKNQKDMFSPECQPDGSYAPVQCFAHANYGTRCWCVDDNGREISRSSVQGGKKPDCEKGGLSLLSTVCASVGSVNNMNKLSLLGMQLPENYKENFNVSSEGPSVKVVFH